MKNEALLGHFISRSQLACISHGLRGEEKSYFSKLVDSLSKTINEMPVTYSQDGMGDKAIVYLHYFTGDKDFYVMEKDAGSETDTIKGLQTQAYGLKKYGESKELRYGYIDIHGMIQHGAEIDFHFEPCTVGELKASL